MAIVLSSMLGGRRLARALRRSRTLRRALLLGERLFAPTHPVGAVAALFDDGGRVLLVEHVFRATDPWGLPGGWVERGEHPARTVQRELEEEIGLRVEVGPLLLCEPERDGRTLTLVYYCRLRGAHDVAASAAAPPGRHELLAVEWADPAALQRALAPHERCAVALAARRFAAGSAPGG